ncbi:hypothetical protein EGW08_010734 [Elysia chlorotica]|uniref:Uncharacterized protein n=1 Tax=Elysia chlorotica TaxID=188477 RepID=A0A433TJ07_ELYCH|nr:hypothetical protein EGW08_010734 [Elysia chlorotica]
MYYHCPTQLAPYESRTLVMSDSSRGVVRLDSNTPVTVLAGTTSASGKFINKGGNGDLEKTLLPVMPHSMLGRTHVVLRPQRSRSLTLKVTSTEPYTVIGIWYSTGTYQEVVLANEMQTWSQEQTCDLVIQSDRPVVVAQTWKDDNTPSPPLTNILPITQWRNFYNLQTSEVQDPQSPDQKTVSIVIRSKHIPGFIGTSGANLEDVTSGLEWKEIGKTQFSHCSLVLNGKEATQFRHFDPDVTFQIIDASLEGQGTNQYRTQSPFVCGQVSTKAQDADHEPVEDQNSQRNADEVKSRLKRFSFELSN